MDTPATVIVIALAVSLALIPKLIDWAKNFDNSKNDNWD